MVRWSWGQWIRLREKINRKTPYLMGNSMVSGFDFPLNQSIDDGSLLIGYRNGPTWVVGLLLMLWVRNWMAPRTNGAGPRASWVLLLAVVLLHVSEQFRVDCPRWFLQWYMVNFTIYIYIWFNHLSIIYDVFQKHLVSKIDSSRLVFPRDSRAEIVSRGSFQPVNQWTRRACFNRLISPNLVD